MTLRRTALIAVMLGACAGADFRLDPSPSCSYRTERAEVRDAGTRDQIRDRPSLGQGHGCVRWDEDDALCWGDNRLGQISARVDSNPGEGFEFDDWRGRDAMPVISAGGAHTCAIASDAVFCWGNNDAGQLGQGDTEPHPGVVEVPEAANATSLASGLLHTCAVTPEGVVCWGDNRRGQLGRGELTCCHGPAPVEGLDATAAQVAAGAFHSCVYAAAPGDPPEEVQPWCWGDDRFGALGDGDPGGTQPTPTPVGELLPGSAPVITSRGLAAGAHHTCMLLAPDALFCWGRNASGELGDGTRTDRARPTRVALPVSAISLSAGGEVGLERDGGTLVASDGTGHTCVRTADLRIWCWGDNAHGQLGVPTDLRTVPSPVPVAGDESWNHVGAGGGFTCGTTTDGQLWCWGANDEGQLGRPGPGSFEPRPTTVVP